MNNRSKGNIHEKKVADYLKTHGYEVERSFGKPGWIPGKGVIFCARDLFSAFDIIAIKQPDEVRFIQVTSGAVAERRSKAFMVWPKSEVWEHVLRGIYRIHRHDQQPIIVDTKREHHIEEGNLRK